MATITITGVVVDITTKLPLPGVRVEAWDKDIKLSDVVGTYITDRQGRFSISYDELRFKENPKDKWADIYFKVYDNNRIVADTRNTQLYKNLSGDQLDITIVVDTAGSSINTYTVQGRLLSNRQINYTAFSVLAFDKDLRSQQKLGETIPDSNGHYLIEYDINKAKNAEKGTADLLVKLVDKTGKTIAESAIRFNASYREIIDINISNESYRGVSELETITNLVSPLLDKIQPHELTEDNKNKDISFLSAELDTEDVILEAFAGAHKLQKLAPVDPSFYYALLRQNIPSKTLLLTGLDFKKPGINSLYIYIQTDAVLKVLLTMPVSGIETAINTAIDKNIIPAVDKNKLKRWLLQWKEFQKSRGDDTTGKSSLLENILAITDLTKAKKTVFLQAYHSAENIGNDFWKKLGITTKLSVAETNQVKAVYDLAGMMNHNIKATTDVVKKYKIKDVASLRKLSSLSERDWEAVVNPSAKTTGKKISEEAKQITKKLEKQFPTAAFAANLSKNKTALKGAEAVKKLHATFPDTELHKINVAEFVKKNKKELQLDKKTEQSFTGDLMKIQRVFKIAPQFKTTQVLLNNDIHSAAGIYNMGVDNFTNLVTTQADVNADEAVQMYKKAEATHALSIAIAGDFQSITSGGSVNALPSMSVRMLTSGLLKEFPDLQTLFGSADMCECQQCRSVYSAAAYLVDVLEYLDKRRSTTAGQSVKEVLFKRRPDIGEIELSCNNTNTAMPFIDLVCEILEDAVADNFLVLPGSLNAELSTSPISSALKAAFISNKLPITEAATVLPGKDSNEWIIRDAGNTFKINKNGSQLQLRISRQTHHTAAELKARPEYINNKAYDILRTKKYPFDLPFDLPWHITTRYLNVLNINRYDLIRAFHLSSGASTLELTYECLFIPKAVGDIIAGVDGGTLNDYWGSITDIDQVTVFLTKTGLAYNQMLQLFECSFINSAGPVKINVPAGGSMCDASIQTISGLTNPVLDQIHRFIRLWQTTGWQFWELNMVVMSKSMENGLINPDFIRKLEQFVWLLKNINCTVEELVNMLDGFATAALPESQVTIRKTLYQKLFLDKAIFEPLDEAFYPENIKQGTAPELLSITATLSDHAEVITGGLKLSADELLLLEGNTVNKKFCVNNLNFLFRYSRLARSLRLSVADVFTMIEFQANSLPISFNNLQNPFLSIDNLYQFYKTASAMLSLPLKTGDYSWLFTNRISVQDTILLNQTITAHLEALRKALIGIDKDLAIDATGSTRDWVKLKLANLGSFDEKSINDFTRIIDRNGVSPVTPAETTQLNTLFTGVLQVTGAGGLINKLNETTPTDEELRLSGKYQYIKDRLTQYFKTTQSREQLVKITAKSVKLTEKASASLLDALEVTTGIKLAEQFLTDSNITTALPVTEANFTTLFRATKLLIKTAYLASKLSLNQQLLTFILQNSTACFLPDLNSLPLVETASGSFIKPIVNLQVLLDLDKKYPGSEELNIVTCLNELFSASGTVSSFNFLISSLTGRDVKQLEKTEAHFGYAFPAAYKSVANIATLDTCLEYLFQLQTGIPEITSMIKPQLTADDALLTENVIKALFERDTWLTRSNEVQSPIRELKRNALARYLINNPPAGQTWNNTNDLYSYYLIDVEMGACEVTTRILQAGLSAQLFVQRCLMQLEKEVIADASQDRKWLQWKWIKNYRVWEANRKVFLYPENYLEPELRPDKSFFFKDLENDLMQNEINTDNVETGYLTYLEKLDNVARLNVCGTYYDENTLIFHVFAHTYDEPRIYYYRKWIKDRYWTPWEKVTADIQSDQLIPVVRNSRLYIYWPEFNEVNEEPSSSELTAPTATGGSYPPASAAKKFTEIRLAVCEFKNKKWSTKKLSKTKIDTSNWSGSFSKENFVFVPIIDSLRSVLDFLYMFIGNKPAVTDAMEDFMDSFGISNQNVIVCMYETNDHNESVNIWGLKHIKTFELGSCHGTPEIADSFTGLTTSGPLIPYFDRSGYNDGEDREITTANPDSLVFHQWGAVPFINHSPLVNKTPGSFRTQFSFQLSLVDKFFYMLGVFVQRVYGSSFAFGDRKTGLPYSTSTFLPFFYEDKSRTFMVQPEILVTYPDPDNPVKTKADELFYSDILQFINEFAANKKIPDELKKYTEEGIKYNFNPAMRFRNFYHPLVCFFMKQVYLSGLDGLLNRDIQLVGDMSIDDTILKDKIRKKFREVKLFDFKKVYDPTTAVNSLQYPEEEVDFAPDGSYSQYNWELFFHGPLYVAGKLSSNQKFEEAMKWYHYIFDPTDASSYDTPQKFWITKPFFLRSSTAPDNEYLKQRIDRILGMIHNNDLELLKQVDDWKDNPFQPHLIAQFRTVAYQKSVVMKYIDNLVAWGDYLFRQNTRESLGQATQLYILAAEILGPKPRIIPNKTGKSPKSYNQLKPGLDGFSNAVIQLENVIPAVPDSASGVSPVTPPPLPAIETFYFCLPINEKLLSYWDTIGLRLFNLRNCLTIDGNPRFNALFDPPIDPALLVKAVASGVDLQDALNDLSAPLPFYRFNLILQKAKEFNNEVRALGTAIMGAIEKKDGEALALLRSTNEIKVMQAALSLKKYAIQDAKENLAGLKQNQKNAELKIRYYGGQLYMNPLESAAFGISTASTIIHTIGSVADVLAGVLALIPQFNGGASGFGGSPQVTVSYGSQQISKAAELGAKVMYQTSAVMDKVSGLISTQAGYVRRKDEWDFQRQMAENDLQQIGRQIASAEIKIAMAEKELKNHELQISNADDVDEFMRTKFSNADLYDWMITQLSGVYFQSYKLALDMAKKAEKCFRYELATETTNFITPGYWDSLHKGLQSAEKLAFDLNRMDGSYIDQNKREHEMTKTVSLSLLDPAALIELKETGKCETVIPESLFDLDCPGHYLRRIKSVSISIPCIAGPYTSVNCKLTLMSSMVRKNIQTGSGYFRDTMNEDARFVYNYGVVQSVITSNAQNDSGLFETNLKDERYLPFEGQGAISRWKVELLQLESGGKHIRNFDFNTISDVLFQLRYTARYGGDPFKKTVNDTITGAMNSIIEYAINSKNKFYRVFPLKHQLATEWHRFFHPPTPSGDQQLLLSLTRDHFPFFMKEQNLQVDDVDIYVRYKKGVTATPYKFTFELATVASPAALGPATDALGLKKYVKPGLNNSVPDTASLDYKLTGWKQSGSNHIKFTTDEVDDIIIVVHYEIV